MIHHCNRNWRANKFTLSHFTWAEENNFLILRISISTFSRESSMHWRCQTAKCARRCTETEILPVTTESSPRQQQCRLPKHRHTAILFWGHYSFHLSLPPSFPSTRNGWVTSSMSAICWKPFRLRGKWYSSADCRQCCTWWTGTGWLSPFGFQ